LKPREWGRGRIMKTNLLQKLRPSLPPTQTTSAQKPKEAAPTAQVKDAFVAGSGTAQNALSAKTLTYGGAQKLGGTTAQTFVPGVCIDEQAAMQHIALASDGRDAKPIVDWLKAN